MHVKDSRITVHKAVNTFVGDYIKTFGLLEWSSALGLQHLTIASLGLLPRETEAQAGHIMSRALSVKHYCNNYYSVVLVVRDRA